MMSLVEEDTKLIRKGLSLQKYRENYSLLIGINLLRVLQQVEVLHFKNGTNFEAKKHRCYVAHVTLIELAL